jgi:diguanylate cyclase (GGDEF)-like protein
MYSKALSVSLQVRTALALFVLGLLLVLASSAWQVREETLRRAELLDEELHAIPLLYAAPLARGLLDPDSIPPLLEKILARHCLLSVELHTQAGEQYQARDRHASEPGPSAEFALGEAGALRVQARAATLLGTLRQDKLLRATLQHLLVAALLGLAAAWLLDRLLLRHLRRLSDEARAFDPTLPPRQLRWLDADERKPRELQQLEQAFAHVHTALGDELQREQTRGLALREEIARQGLALQNAERALEAKKRELASLERVDALTGLANRREFDQQLRREFKRAQRDQGRLALAVLDLDHLRPYNERHGRAAGDALLSRFAQLLAERFKRDTDLVARLGGEEFAVLLPGLDAALAQGLLDSLREDWRALQAQEGHGAEEPGMADPVTVSIGLAACTPRRPFLSPQSLLQAADEALYLAKHTGRDRLCLAA